MSRGSSVCPICPLPARVQQDGQRDAWEITCQRCGTFVAVGTLMSTLHHNLENRPLLPYLSAHTRQASERGERPELNSSNWRAFADEQKKTRVAEKPIKLLRALAPRGTPPGTIFPVDAALDYPLADAVDAKELGFLMRPLDESGFIRQVAGGMFEITIEGWAAIDAAK